MSSARSPHPFLFTLLIVPFGAVSGFASVVLAFLATKRGLTVEEGASLVAIGMIPHAWKFFWAPVADMTFSRKGWYVASTAISAIGVLLMGAIPLGPENLRLLQVVIFVTNLASTFVGMAVEGLMAHGTAPEERGRVGGWFQAGNLGGSGIGGGLGLWLATRYQPEWVSGLPGVGPWLAANLDAGRVSGGVLALVLAGCGLALLGIHDPPTERNGNVLGAVKAIGLDLLGLLNSRMALLGALMCFLPIGTGAAAGVLAQAEVAAKWGAGENEVGMVNGVFSGVIAAVGCIVGGQLCGRFGSFRMYAAVGALMAVVTGSMAFSPMNASMFVSYGLVYAFVTGLAYAAFSGLVLEVIGAGAAATKYNMFASLSNIPIGYMGLVLAAAFTRWDGPGMLLAESGAGIAGILLFVLAYGAFGPKASKEARLSQAS